MKVIIKQDTPGLGKTNEVVDVKDGYAANYLIPKGIVALATRANERVLAENTRQSSEKNILIKQQAQELAKKIRKTTIKLEAQASKGKIFGTITNLQIAKAISEQIGEAQFTHEQVILEAPIKEIGTHTAELKLNSSVKTEVTLEIVAI